MRYLIIILLVPFFSKAQVINSSEHGFKLTLVSQVNVNQVTAYQQFIKINQWWSSEHTWFGNAKNLTLAPKVGGCFCEIDDKKQALHMTITYVVPNNEIRMVGGLGPLQMMGVTGGMSWTFEETDTNKTTITLNYHATGYLDTGLDKMAPFVDRVQRQQLDRLSHLLNQN